MGKYRDKIETITSNKELIAWIEEMAEMCKPDDVVWIDGSDEQKQALTKEALKTGELIELDQEKLPGCFLHRSAQNDVARTESLTFICTEEQVTAGPLNNWKHPNEAYEELGGYFDNSMKGRTMYLIPFSMGPLGSDFSKIGIQITDSIYVVLNMMTMTRAGKRALEILGDSDNFTKCLHGKSDLDIEKRRICHFPEDNTIWSVGSGYGGNALLGKKCLSLRIASHMASKEGWMAEHMLIMGIESPEGEIHYIAAAFPSACGKTNLAMLVPPTNYKGYKIWTVGDDICWMRIGKDGRLWAINPEAGFFGVAPGTSNKTNPNAMESVQKNSIFTNVVLSDDNTVWWEGIGHEIKGGTDWKGERWTPDSNEPGAHPNSRFTAPIHQAPSFSEEWGNPKGVPISAILFGGRRAKLDPLVYESFNWQHGTFIGATLASEKTAAAEGKIGEARRDPMAMLPFCGYHMGDYFQHWLNMGKNLENAPKIFHVNWFRTDEKGDFMWPGFGENLRVLKWVIDRSEGRVDAVKTPIGFLPNPESIDLNGLDIGKEQLNELLKVDKEDWIKEVGEQKEFFKKFDKIPKEIIEENKGLEERLNLWKGTS
ncbi:MAG: phosphoenolpyruvate carboxykinase (GTP) [Candidatus Diapherotrites archaeon]